VKFGYTEFGNEDSQILFMIESKECKKRKAALADSFSSPKSNPIVNLNVQANLC
jgi:hypothetical protein